MLMPVINGKDIDDETLGHIGRIVGDRIAKLARERGWSQGQMAQNMTPKRSQGTVSMIMRGGIIDPPISTLIAFARLFNVTLDQLVGFTPLPEAPPVSASSGAADDIDLKTLREELIATNKRQKTGIGKVQEMEGKLDQVLHALAAAGLLDEQAKPRKKPRAG